MLSSHMNWQSWSPPLNSFIKWPVRNFPPLPQIATDNKKPANFTLAPPITGICTWYRLANAISPANIIKFAQDSKKIHTEIEYCLIDDGWCQWGDWLSPRFSLKKLSQKLTKLNLKTGLWYAPFLADHQSTIFKNHPEYFVKDCRGQLVEGTKCYPIDRYRRIRRYILDFSNSDVKKYIYQSIKTAIESWQITLLKLDFLYAPYFDPKLSDDLLPHQFLVDLFTWIKTKYPDVYLIACGCPFKPAKYIVDAIRISKDITIPFLYPYPIIKSIVHTNKLNNLIAKWNRYQSLSKYFNLDPDVMPDQKQAGFSDHQMQSLGKIFNQSLIKFYG